MFSVYFSIRLTPIDQPSNAFNICTLICMVRRSAPKGLILKVLTNLNEDMLLIPSKIDSVYTKNNTSGQYLYLYCISLRSFLINNQ